MGLLDLHAVQAGITEPPLQTLPRTVGERVEATIGDTFAPDRYFTIGTARREMWQRAVDELHGATGEALPNPYGAVTPAEMMRLGNQPAIEAERRNAIIEKARAARETTPDLFDPENIDRYIGEEAQRRRGKAASYEGTGNGIVNFLAAAGLETLTPHGAIGLVIPVTRLPGAAASAVGRTFLGNVGREAAFQGAANAGLQTFAEGLDYLSRSETGTAQTLGEVVTNIAGAAVIGGAIGGGVRALHLKWLGLSEKVRADAPIEVRDAFRVIEAESLYSGQNRLGVDPLLHERYQGRATDAVMRGRPVELADLSRTADTPMTALGTILRNSPETIRADIGGLGNALDRIKALPDQEIESFLREVRPEAFAALDDIARRSAELDARAAAIDQEVSQIGVSDIVDIDTGARLQFVDERLKAKGLRKKERADLERERESIVESIDPQGKLPGELTKVRADFLPEQQAALREIEEARVALKRETDAARSVLTREVEQVRGKIDGLTVGSRYADDAPADVLAREFGGTPDNLGAALVRADVLRQARMLREFGIGETPRATAPETTAPAAALTPEQTAALKTETARLVEANPQLEVEINGRTMSAAKAMEEADRLDKEANIAMNCAVGAL